MHKFESWGFPSHLHADDYSTLISSKSKRKLDEYLNSFPDWNTIGLLLLSQESISLDKVTANFSKKLYLSSKIKEFIKPIFCPDFFSGRENDVETSLQIKRADFVIFSELGVSGGMDLYGKERLSKVINYFILSNKKCIFSTRQTPERLKDLLGESLSIYLTQNCKRLIIDS